METITHATIAMLAVINPFVCGAMLLQAEQGIVTIIVSDDTKEEKRIV